MKKISLSVVCPMASCTRSNTCARYAQYVKALTCADTFEVLNVKHLQCEGEKCPYHLVSEKQVWARGFQRIYSTIPAGRTHYFYSRTPYARRRFYKAKNGEIAIDPDMQQHLISIFREHTQHRPSATEEPRARSKRSRLVDKEAGTEPCTRILLGQQPPYMGQVYTVRPRTHGYCGI